MAYSWGYGLGTLTIGGTTLNILQNSATFTGECEIVEGWKSQAAGKPRVCVERVISKVGGVLKIESAKITSASTAFTFLTGTLGETLTSAAVTYTRSNADGYAGIQIYFANANVIPTGNITMSQDGYAVISLEIRNIGTTLPTVTIS